MLWQQTKKQTRISVELNSEWTCIKLIQEYQSFWKSSWSLFALERIPTMHSQMICRHRLMWVTRQTNVVCLGDLNHFQVHRDSDFTCVPYFRSLPQSQSRAQSLSEGASHNHPHNTKRSAQFTEVIEVLSIISGLEHMSAPSQGVHIYGLQVI